MDWLIITNIKGWGFNQLTIIRIKSEIVEICSNRKES